MYEWLNGYQKLEQEIYYLDWELETYKSELKRWCNPEDLGRYSLTKESKASKLEDIIADHEKRLADKMNQIYDLRTLIYSFKGLDQHILRMKYIEGLTLKEIAKELNHNYGYIRNKHRDILKKIDSDNDVTLPIAKS
ncbi:sigma factor-like helix-turn-helix DNA-binding protein [Enterococcus sp. LJL120]